MQHRATDNVRNRIRRNPWQAIGLAAVVGFIVGITR
ncbi:glycine zipper domain-containing protein [Aliirhizobium cellulosilyticum]